ncbi:MAG TPA: hypothetical protein VFN77_06905, partial [Acetobacteraceae bacterium]|nr:hypothetical protein [Acetobacteraceae bacterium]
MPTPYSSADLDRVFDSRSLIRGRSLMLIGAVEVRLEGDVITATVDEKGIRRTATLIPAPLGRKVVFDARCTCRHPACVHLAAGALAALDRFPELRRAEQKSFIDMLSADPADERRRLVFSLAPGEGEHACFVSASLVGEATGRVEPVSPGTIAADPAQGEAAIAIARLLGGGEAARAGIAAEQVAKLLELLLKSGQGRWAPTAKRLVPGVERVFDAGEPPKLPAKSGVIISAAGPWYVDAATGAVGRIRLRAAPPPPINLRPPPRRPAAPGAADSERVIVERPATPVLRLRRLPCPDDFGRLQTVDA